LSEAIAVLAGLDLTGLPDQLGGLCVSELQTLLGGVVPVLTRLGGVHSAVLGELTVRTGGTVPSAPLPQTPDVPGPSVAVAHWLRDLTGTTGTTAGSAVRRSGLLRQLPLVLAAVVAGELGTAQAGVLTRLVGALPAQALAEAEPALIEVARGMDPTALGAYVAFLIATWVEPVFEADQRSQEAKRFLTTRREADGMLSGRFRLTTGDSEALLTALEPLARRNALADQRDAGQRRADALVEMCQQLLAFGDLPDAGGFRPQLSYVVPAGWAAGHPPDCTFAELVAASLARTSRLDDLTQDTASGQRPVTDCCASGAWTGPQTRARIEMLLCDARITRVLLQPHGQVATLETLTDPVTKAQRRALAARDHGCVARGCTQPPAFCDAHHLHHLAHGGCTHLDNLVLLCRRHHLLWHQGRLALHHLHVPWLTGHQQPPRTGASTNTHDPPF